MASKPWMAFAMAFLGSARRRDAGGLLVNGSTFAEVELAPARAFERPGLLPEWAESAFTLAVLGAVLVRAYWA